MAESGMIGVKTSYEVDPLSLSYTSAKSQQKESPSGSVFSSIASGLSSIGEAFTPLATSIIGAASTAAQQRRAMENQQGQTYSAMMPSFVPSGMSPTTLATIGVVGLVAVLALKRRKR